MSVKITAFDAKSFQRIARWEGNKTEEEKTKTITSHLSIEVTVPEPETFSKEYVAAS